MEIAAPAGAFLLTAKADRIDSLAAGTLAIIDYKTGEPPKEKEVLDGLAPQLPLEAAIAEAGGFKGFPPATVSALHYWRLRGDDKDGEKSIKALNGLADAALGGLRRLIETFDASEYGLCVPAATAPGATFQRGRAPRPRQGVGGGRGGRRMMHAPVSNLYELDDPSEPQRGASDPGASVWVAASAGTGKTKVLTDRVLRLMLAGSDPARILCLTYTKAAAAEMANRIADRLGDWATCR